ncbi:MAG: hypothetical protein WA208_16370 [Thermoanaerobaculia bacterium]
MSWLKTLPHQIPFRAASAVLAEGERTIEGVFSCTANDLLPPELMVVEAMAQFAGGLAFHQQHGHGYLSGIDRCEVRRAILPGEKVVVRVTLEAEFGGTFRFAGTGSIDGVEVAAGRFYLASPGDRATV